MDETAEGGLLSQFQPFSTPARALAVETLKLERVLSAECGMRNAECRMQSGPYCGCCALTPAEIELMWKTTPPRMPIPWPLGMREVPISPAEFVQ